MHGYKQVTKKISRRKHTLIYILSTHKTLNTTRNENLQNEFYVLFTVFCGVFFFSEAVTEGKKEKELKKRTLKSPLPLAKFISRNVTLF